MFENLDDPNPPDFGSERRTSVLVRARDRRRQRRRRRVRTSLAGGVALVAVVAGFAAYEGGRLNDVAKVRVGTRPATDSGVETILVVGTDRGIGVGPPRADAIAAIRIDRARHRVTALRIPRDLEVGGRGTAGVRKLSGVLQDGGPAALVDAVHQDLGLDVQHLVMVDPAGMASLIDLVGGVRVKTSHDIRDGWFPGSPSPSHASMPLGGTGFTLTGGTCRTLDGADAVALARSRHLAVHINGKWVEDGSGDLGRMQRQNELAVALLGSFDRVDVTSPSTLDHLVDVFVDHVTVDSGLGTSSLVDLARTLHGMQPGSVTATGLPVKTVMVPRGEGAESGLELADGWQRVVSDFEAGAVQRDATRVTNGATGATLPSRAVAQISAC